MGPMLLRGPLKPPKPKEKDSFLVAFGIYGGVGFQLAISVVAGLLFGNYLDEKLGTKPWLAMTGLILGSIGGFYNLLRILTWSQKRRSSKKP